MGLQLKWAYQRGTIRTCTVYVFMVYCDEEEHLRLVVITWHTMYSYRKHCMTKLPMQADHKAQHCMVLIICTVFPQ